MPHTRRTFLHTAAAVSMAAPLSATTPNPDLRLWYAEPAPDWNEALPIGAGRLGAMVFGGVAVEHLQLNEDTLCSEEPGTGDLDLDVTKEFDRVTGLLRNGDYAEAAALITKNWGGRSWPCYQPVGDLHLHFDDHTLSPSAYVRELDLASAMSRVSYEVNGTVFTREYFASYPDRVIVARLTASQKEALSFRASLSSVHPAASSRAAGPDTIAMKGQAPGFVLRRTLDWVEKRGEQWKYPEVWDKDGNRRPDANQILYGKDVDGRGAFFEAQVRAIAKDGRIEAREDGLHVRNSSEAVLILSAATSYNGFDRSPSRAGADPSRFTSPDPSRFAGADPSRFAGADPSRLAGADPSRLAGADLTAASRKSYTDLKAAHTADYRKLFDRVSIDMGAPTSQSHLPTGERVERFANGLDPSLAALYFQYGRYLMIAGSRPGTQPLNLQGIWNDKVIPPWACGYTTNINVEMNYWPVEVANLSECYEPLDRMLHELSVTGGQVARKMYKRRGWVLHHNTTLWRGAQPVDNDAMPAFWNAGGGWLCSHLWEHYQFTGDRRYLADRAYPLMKGAAEFLSDWLVDDGHGHLVTAAGNSPENTFVYTDHEGKKRTAGITMGPTMDLAIVRELFSNCIRAAELLNRDRAFRVELQAKLDKLLPYQVGKRGQLQEWPEDFDEREPRHRHVSHLYALHPSNQITRAGAPKLFDAAKRTLELRGDEGTGWSRAWKICFWARLQDGNHAYRIVRNLFQPARSAPGKYDRGGVLPNLFCSCPPMQIDGNFGGVAGIAEMLLQSQQGEVHLLPALPDAWPTGSVRGLRARGGFEIAIQWRDGKLESAAIGSTIGGPCVVRYGDKISTIATEAGKTYRWS